MPIQTMKVPVEGTFAVDTSVEAQSWTIVGKN